MRKRTLGVVLLAGLAMSGAGAFTAANDVPDSVAGYGEATVTGATVTDIDYNLDVLTDSDVVSIVFTTTEDLTATEATLKLTDNGTDINATNACVSTVVLTVNTTTCTFTPNVPLENFDGMNLLVLDLDV